MRLVIREYLRMLKESGELDEFLPELLLKMGFILTSKAQKGVRQGGVDIAAVGKDTTDRETLLLLVVKCGNITRSNWDNGENSVRASLNEVRDVYLQTKVLPAHKEHIKKIVLCTNGDIIQAVDPHWHGYVTDNTVEGKIEFDFWGLDRLTSLVETHLLDESALPDISRSDFRKALALISEPEYDLAHYYKLLDTLLFYNNEGMSERLDYKTFKQAINTCNLLLTIMFRWAQSENNLRNVLLASERTLLWGWELIRRKNFTENKNAITQYVLIYRTYIMISNSYFNKLQGHFHTRDALSIHSPEHIFASESVFEHIGIVALIGLNQITNTSNQQAIMIICEGLANIIANNPNSSSPCYDRHANEISLALIFMFYAGQHDNAKNWLSSLCNSLIFCYSRGRNFPVGSDSFDDTVELTVHGWDGPLAINAKSISTIIAVIAQWCCLFNMTTEYTAIVTLHRKLQETCVQLWFPDDKTENLIYYKSAQYESGSSLAPITLPDTIDEYIAEIRELKDVSFISTIDDFSASKAGFKFLLMTASRHFQTPIIHLFLHDLILRTQTK